jgi:hypothetical protein
MRSWVLLLGALLSVATTACTRAETQQLRLVGKELPRQPPAPWEHVRDSLIEGGPTAYAAAQPLFRVTIWSSGDAGALLLSQSESAAGSPRWMVLAITQVQVPKGHFVTDRCELDGRADPELFAVVASEAPCPQWYTHVAAGFRLSRSGRRIEPVPARGIRCACMSYGMDAR